MLNLAVKRLGKLGQRLPAGVDRARFTADQDRLLTLLQAQGLDVGRYDSAFNPYPFVVPGQRLGEWLALQESIQRAIVAVVTHFDRDPRFAAVIQLPAVEREWLARIAARPYRPGGFRPDFLFAANGREMVTEINGRFPLNGFLTTLRLGRCLAQLDPRFVPPPSLARVETALRSRLGATGPLGIVKASEPGWDIHLVKTLWGERCEMIAPQELTAARLGRWRGVVLELHQHELLGEVPAEIQVSLAAHPGLLNDLRTIFIAHDKRLLALLSDGAVLGDYLDTDDVARLRRHIIPTWVKGLAPHKVYEALAHPDSWLAKPPRSGKGKGIVVSSQLKPAAWRQTLLELPDDWVLQPYVEQRTFPITTLRQGELVTARMKVVGMLPALDEHTFGPGLFRAAEDDVVNVARGGIILAPAVKGGKSCPQ